MQLRRLYVHSPRQKKNVYRPPKIKFDDGKTVLPLCNGKVCYDRATARASKQRQQRDHGIRLRVYPHSCGYWHLTKQTKSKTSAVIRNKGKFTPYSNKDNDLRPNKPLRPD